MSISLTNFFQNQISSKQGVEFFRKLIVTDLKGTEEIDLSSFVTNWGSISRRLQYETGKSSPGSHSFTIQDSKDLGKFLFTLGVEFGTEFWMDKTYNISVGFLNGQTEDVVNIGTFEIYSKKENRINGSITVSAKDAIKKLNDFRVCTKILAEDVFEIDSGTDIRGFTQVIRYGLHKLIKNSDEARQVKQRNNPFSMTLGFPNVKIGDVSGGAASHPVNHVWYFPFHNEIDDTASLYRTDGEFSVYFWDYIDDKWRAIPKAEFDSGDINITIESVGGIDGAYATIEDPAEIDLGDGVSNDNWTEYINGTGTHFNVGVNDQDDIDISLSIETQDALTDDNPARVIHDLLTNSRFIGLPATQLDFSSFSSPDEDFTFDKTFKFIQESTGRVNVSFDKETTLLKVIEAITNVGAMFFFTTGKKSTSLDNRIKLEIQQPFRQCAGDIPNFLEYSIKDYIDSYSLDTTSDTKISQVQTANFDSSTSSKDSLEIRRQPSTSPSDGKVLQFGTASNPKAYWFNSGGWAQAVSSRYFNWFSNPIENIDLGLSKAGLPIEAFDLVKVHDEISGNTITLQVFDTRLNLNDFIVSVSGSRFEKLFGPDVDEPLKKWSFATTDSNDPCAAFATTNVAPNGKPSEPQINASWHSF